MTQNDNDLERHIYVDLLQIPPEQCPPNHFDLLGIRPKEVKAELVERRAKARTAAIRKTPLPAKLHVPARSVLKRIEKARICLSDPNARSAYLDRISPRKIEKPKRDTGAPPPDGAGAKVTGSRHTSALPELPETATGDLPTLDDITGPGFDDLMGEIPETSSTLRPIPKVEPKHLPHKQSSRNKKQLPIAAISIGGTSVAVLLLGAILFFTSGGPKPDEISTVSTEAKVAAIKAAPSIEETLDTTASVEEVHTAVKVTIPKLPIAHRSENEEGYSVFSIGGGKLFLKLPMPFSEDESIRAYIAGDSPSTDDTVMMTYNGEYSEGGYFNVNGRPVAPKVYVDNQEVLRWLMPHELNAAQSNHEYSMIHRLVFLSPGTANLIIHFDGQEIRLPFEVTRISLPQEFGEKELVDLMSFPDRKEEGVVSWPNKRTVDGEVYEAKAGGGGGYWDHWYYEEYPTVAFIPHRHKLRHIAPASYSSGGLGNRNTRAFAAGARGKSPGADAQRSRNGKPPETPPRKIFSEMPKEISLPSLADSRTELEEGELAPIDLGNIGELDPSTLAIAFDQPVVVDDSTLRFELIKTTTESDTPEWEVRLKSETRETEDEKSTLDEVGSGLDEHIGTLYLEDSHLKMRFHGTEHLLHAQQIRNCVLCLEADTERHRLQLRPKTLVPPKVLDYDESAHKIEFTAAALPPEDTMFLQLTSFDKASVNLEQRPTDGIIRPGAKLRLAIKDWSRPAEIEIVFRIIKDKPTVAIRTRYRLERRWSILTTKRLNSDLVDMQKALNEHRHRLSNCKSAVSSLPSQIRSTSDRLSRSKGGGEQAQLKLRLNMLQREFRAARSGIKRYQKSIPEFEQKIPALKELAEIGNRLHKQAVLNLRVGINTENGEIILLETTDDLPPPVEEEAVEESYSQLK